MSATSPGAARALVAASSGFFCEEVAAWPGSLALSEPAGSSAWTVIEHANKSAAVSEMSTCHAENAILVIIAWIPRCRTAPIPRKRKWPRLGWIQLSPSGKGHRAPPSTVILHWASFAVDRQARTAAVGPKQHKPAELMQQIRKAPAQTGAFPISLTAI